MTTPADSTWYWRPRPAECVRPRTAESIRRETHDLIREREQEHAETGREWARAMVTLMMIHRAEVEALEALVQNAGDAVADAMDGEQAALTALRKVFDALAEFEARAQRDPAGAARALCRWLEKVRTSGERKAA